MKYIFVTGGVVSSLGKGLAAASLGTLLEARGLRVVLQKFDPYLNVDPGTMNPFQHGEVYVLNVARLDHRFFRDAAKHRELLAQFAVDGFLAPANQNLRL